MDMGSDILRAIRNGQNDTPSYANTNTNTHAYTHTRTCTNTNANTHTYTRTPTHTCTRAVAYCGQFEMGEMHGALYITQMSHDGTTKVNILFPKNLKSKFCTKFVQGI